MATEEKSLIAIANERMTIIEACNKLGMDVFDFSVASLKVYCPFGSMFHVDEGMSKAMRIYPASNSAWCFAGCGYFTPTRLISMDRGITEEEAAEVILEDTKYVPPDYESRWDAAVVESQLFDTEPLAEALRTACIRMAPDWEERQFEENVATKFRQCLSLLRKVKTDEDARKWSSATKQIMNRVLGEHA